MSKPSITNCPNTFFGKVHSFNCIFSSLSCFACVQIRHPPLSGGYCGGVPPLPIPNREVKPVRADGTAYSGRVGSRRPFRLSAALEKVSSQRHSFFCSTLLFFFCSTLLLISCLLFSQFISGAFNCFTLASRLLLDGYSLFSKYSCARVHWHPAISAY